MSLGINPYHLIKIYNASNFLTEFAYFNQPDPTNGLRPCILTEFFEVLTLYR